MPSIASRPPIADAWRCPVTCQARAKIPSPVVTRPISQIKLYESTSFPVASEIGTNNADWTWSGENRPSGAPIGCWSPAQKNGDRPSSRHFLFQFMIQRCCDGSPLAGRVSAKERTKGHVERMAAAR